MKTFILCLLSSLFVYTSIQGQELKLTADTYTFRFRVIKYYPFICLKINDTEGLAMFDTGTEERLMINTHRVKMPAGARIGTGSVGSGQTMEIFRHDTVQRISFCNGLEYLNVQNVLSFDIGFIEVLSPDILGFIGYNFFSGYVFKLDYAKGLISFYKHTPQRKDFLENEQVLAVLDFETHKLPNHPIIKLKIGGVDFSGSFDTGQQGCISLPDSLQKEFSKRGVLQLSDSTAAIVNEIELQGNMKVNAVPVEYFPQSKTQENTLSIGYGFLSKFKTVWDYEEKKIYLLKK